MSIGISRIQRWVDRLTAACDQKKWAAAVSEADCLSAEIKLVREKLWENAESELSPVSHSKPVIMGVKVVLSAFIIVCCTTLPIAIESGISVAPARRDIVFVSSEEKELLAMLREDLSGKNVPVIMTEKQEDNKRVVASAPKEDIIKSEDLIALVQIGQRSLMGNTPVIKIIQ